ncbi:MAG TPA: hypothetical protein VEK07_22535 [Polyangiaceae bacterium]|nr:hypothetical protein [Polyangiaceae bacterium]
MRASAVALAFAASAIVLAAADAHADHLTIVEADRLIHGQTIVRDEAWESSGRRYVGGVAYALVDAPADQIANLAANTEIWRRILPRVRSAHRVGTAGGDALVEINQGTALISATYTLRVRREGGEIRFWMDTHRPHDIEDAWGFLRAQPHDDGRALVTYGILIDIGPGILRDMFEDRVRIAALSVLDRLRGVVMGSDGPGMRANR